MFHPFSLAVPVETRNAAFKQRQGFLDDIPPVPKVGQGVDVFPGCFLWHIDPGHPGWTSYNSEPPGCLLVPRFWRLEKQPVTWPRSPPMILSRTRCGMDHKGGWS